MSLFYHRVADNDPNDWTMSCAQFESQIDWLSSHFDLISLEEAQRRITLGYNVRPAVSITFDDGYADNCEFALPLLIKRRIPCTYFVSLQHVADEQPFPHDIKRGKPLQPNTIEELRGLAVAGIEIGSHTRTHADLGAIQELPVLEDEIVSATRELGDAVGQTIRYFAFPYGQHHNMQSVAFSLAKRAGIRAVCSAYGGYNFPGEDSFHIQRIHADPELTRVRNWLTVDPRKLRMTRRFEYEDVPIKSESCLV